ncbi:hypothetical protein [Streptomyces acidicola]|uniref:hypothetical protein n=1 Tax=Streptomyces acidicola TaxID=2596892 RepID=UPI0038252F0D
MPRSVRASMLCALKARFQAILGHVADNEAAAGRALDTFERVDEPDEEPHTAFFDLPGLHATLGMAHQIAAKHLDGAAPTRHVRRSTDLVVAALNDRPEHHQRSRAFDHLGLARTYPAAGEGDGAAEETTHCLRNLGSVRSRRVADRLGELYEEAQLFAETTPGRSLREQIHDLLSASG